MEPVEQAVVEYPDEYSDDGDELDTFILPYPTGSKLGKKKRKKKHKKKWYVRLRCGKKTGKKWHYSAYSKTYKVK